MLNGIRKLLSVDDLAAKIVGLEQENAQLKKQLKTRCLATSFNEVKQPLTIGDGLRDAIFKHAADALEPVISEHLLRCLKKIAKDHSPSARSYIVNAAIADFRDMQIEVVLPEQRTVFRVPGDLVTYY